MKTIRVNTARPYDVLVGAGLLSRCGELIAAVHAPCTAAIITDDTVGALFAAAVEESLAAAGFRPLRFTFPHGEEHKNLETFAAAHDFLAEQHLTRSDLIVALGGGVVGDLAGFVAATHLRGIPFVQIPTTLLAAVDSSVGGKTAVDLARGKNLCGCFSQPELVLCDYETLATLPPAIFADGMAEVIKYGVLGDEDFFTFLLAHDIRDEMEDSIARCIAMKRDLVEADEFDNGERQKLNLGHTIGHAIEKCSNFTISHGSAVGIGMVIIARAAAKQGLCSPELSAQAEALLKKYALPTTQPFGAEALFEAAASDKKVRGRAMNIVVPRAIGRCELKKIPLDELKVWIETGLNV
ncbi:MAG: 3-dehydroquinate synthase [Oscillospiraceae bacterium]|nr:3-dehydroquinate synthase [Oscillospiraceae bacterium]